MDTLKYEVGELFVYTNGERWELGVVKSQRSDTEYWSYFSTGDTASLTYLKDMHKLENSGYTKIEGHLDEAHKEIESYENKFNTVRQYLNIVSEFLKNTEDN